MVRKLGLEEQFSYDLIQRELRDYVWRYGLNKKRIYEEILNNRDARPHIFSDQTDDPDKARSGLGPNSIWNLVSGERTVQQKRLDPIAAFLRSVGGYPDWFLRHSPDAARAAEAERAFRSFANSGVSPTGYRRPSDDQLRVHEGTIEIRDLVYCFRYLIEMKVDYTSRLLLVRGVFQALDEADELPMHSEIEVDWTAVPKYYVDGFAWFDDSALTIELRSKDFDGAVTVEIKNEPSLRQELEKYYGRNLKTRFPYVNSVSDMPLRVLPFKRLNLKKRPVGVLDQSSLWFPNMQGRHDGGAYLQSVLDAKNAESDPYGLPFYYFFPSHISAFNEDGSDHEDFFICSVDWANAERDIHHVSFFTDERYGAEQFSHIRDQAASWGYEALVMTDDCARDLGEGGHILGFHAIYSEMSSRDNFVFRLSKRPDKRRLSLFSRADQLEQILPGHKRI